MKVPLIQKIEVLEISEDSIRTIFDRNPIGMAPLILELDEVVIPHREAFAANCLKILKERGINPFYPYPCYILSPEKIEMVGLPQIRSIEEAPKHFIKKIKRVKNREQALLSKADTHRARIQNHSVSKDLTYLHHKREENRKLRDLCHEKNFYIRLIEKMSSYDI